MSALQKIKNSCTQEKPSLSLGRSFSKPLKLKEMLCPLLIKKRDLKNKFHIYDKQEEKKKKKKHLGKTAGF